MFKDQVDKVLAYDEIIIFGVGKIGAVIFNILKPYIKKQKLAFCDNADYLQGEYFEYCVYSVEKAINMFPNAIYILTGLKYSDAMREQLISLGIPASNICNGLERDVIDEANRLYNYVDDRDRTKPLSKIRFEIDCTEHCNLNCIGCSVFASLSKPSYIDEKKLELDLKRMSEIFHQECDYIYLIGGEPLLHPNIAEIAKMSRKYFPMGEISIFTNGTLILKQSEELWEVCRNNNISLIITKYPVMIDYNIITQKLDEENVIWSWAFSNDCLKYMECENIDLEGKQDILKSFKRCPQGNNCIKLKNGRLYTCNVVSSIYKFNNYFGKDLYVSEDDYIDIYKELTANDILKKLSEPIQFCKYCKKSEPSKKFKWKVSENDIDEWIC